VSRYEIWGLKGLVASREDSQLARKVLRATSAPCAIALGASVLSVREGTTPKQREAIEALVKAAHPEAAKIVVPTPDPARAHVHRTPLVTGRKAVETDDDEETADTDGERGELEESDEDDDTDTTPAVERAIEAVAPAPTTQEVPVSAKTTAPRATCAAKGCTGPVPPETGPTRRSVPWRAPYCHRCRDRGRHAINRGHVTPETVAAYLDGRDHRDTAPATKARAEKRSSGLPTKERAPTVDVPITRKAVARPTVAADAVELCSGQIQVTVTLPDDVARAVACAAKVGGIDALERLVDAVLAVRP